MKYVHSRSNSDCAVLQVRVRDENDPHGHVIETTYVTCSILCMGLPTTSTLQHRVCCTLCI